MKVLVDKTFHFKVKYKLIKKTTYYNSVYLAYEYSNKSKTNIESQRDSFIDWLNSNNAYSVVIEDRTDEVFDCLWYVDGFIDDEVHVCWFSIFADKFEINYCAFDFRKVFYSLKEFENYFYGKNNSNKGKKKK